VKPNRVDIRCYLLGVLVGVRGASEGLLVNDSDQSVVPAGDAPSEGDDYELVRRVATCDDVALIDLYRRHAPVILNQILLVVDERTLAEEILQDTMIVLWRQAWTFRGESRVRTWMIAIARRHVRCPRLHQGDGLASGHPYPGS